MNNKTNEELLKLSKSIVDADGKDHLKEFDALCVKNNDDLVKHIYETLESEKTQLIRCDDGVASTNSGVCFAYNKDSNTMIVFKPDGDNFKHTAYCPKDGEARFEVKKTNVKIDQGGLEPEIKHGIYELLPELKKEQERTQSASEATTAPKEMTDKERERQERIEKLMQQAKESEKQRENSLSGGRNLDR